LFIIIAYPFTHNPQREGALPMARSKKHPAAYRFSKATIVIFSLKVKLFGYPARNAVSSSTPYILGSAYFLRAKGATTKRVQVCFPVLKSPCARRFHVLLLLRWGGCVMRVSGRSPCLIVFVGCEKCLKLGIFFFPFLALSLSKACDIPPHPTWSATILLVRRGGKTVYPPGLFNSQLLSLRQSCTLFCAAFAQMVV